jgi:hypothetical protein
MHSFASLAIFAFSGSADFMILATGAKLRMLASESRLLDEPFEGRCRGSEEEGEEVDDMIARCTPTISEALLQRKGSREGFYLVRGGRRESIGLTIVETDCGWMELWRRQSQHRKWTCDGRRSAQIRTKGGEERED